MFKSILRRKKPSSTETTIINPDRATFFALPAELRLEIYHLATQDFTLTLRSDLDKNPRKNSLKPDNYTTHPRPIPSLLLVSRQCRNETLPILLSTATIKIRVSDFDFKDLVRVEGSLYATELKALRRNENVWILMRFPGQGVMRSEERVRRWVTHRSTGLSRIPWRYRIGAHHQGDSPPLAVINREIDYWKCVARLNELGRGMPESLAWEVQAIVASLDESFKDDERCHKQDGYLRD